MTEETSVNRWFVRALAAGLGTAVSLFAPATSKARRDGFAERVDSRRMFLGLFERFRRDKIIP